jgi:general secretion pathway protein J
MNHRAGRNRLTQPWPDSGFTLIETLVALVVLGFVVIGLAQGLRFGMSAWDRQVRTTGRDSALDSTDRTLRMLIAGIAPGDNPHQPNINGDVGQLAFTTELPENAPSPLTRLADVALLVDASHRLVLRWTPHLHVLWLRPLTSVQSVLLPGVKQVSFAYYAAVSRAGPAGWRQSWVGVRPPELVRVHLILDNPSSHWPDIIAAPMREPDD